MESLKKFDTTSLIIGRTLLGVYFLVPGISKIFDYSGTLELMVLKGVFLAQIALPITIVIQVGLALALLFNKYVRISSLTLVALTLLINIYIHDFWNLAGDPSQGHELQNFVKNLAILAGLLVLSTTEKD
jgi:putative oxidoreductase|tara:strand:- start:3286 stop:3675 length:390 start_codon:yes stop_codon:yes gene_type:complete